MMVTFESRHSIHYTGPSAANLRVVADSLIGLERIGQCLPDILAHTPIGPGPIRVEIYLDSIVTGSLTSNPIIRFLFPDEKKLQAWLKRVRDTTGYTAMTRRMPILGPLIGGLVLYGGITAVNKMAGKDSTIPGTVINLTNCQNVVIAQGSNSLQMSPEALTETIQRYAGNGFNLASNVCRTIGPAKISGESLIIDDNASLTIPKAAVQEVPIHVERGKRDILTQNMEKVTIEIHAMDIDSRKKGWAIVVPSVTQKRLKLEILPTVEPSTIAFHSSAIADIELRYRETDEGDRVYTEALLLKVHAE